MAIQTINASDLLESISREKINDNFTEIQTGGLLANAAIASNAAIEKSKLQETMLGYAEVTATQNFTTETDLTSLSVSVTVPSGGRKVRISATAAFSSTIADDFIALNIKESTTTLQQAQIRLSSANVEINLHKAVVLTPSAGAHTYKLSAVRTSGSGTCTLNVASTRPSFILVELL